jgi:dihydrofolate synthase/folylpolyglutamate synthase
MPPLDAHTRAAFDAANAWLLSLITDPHGQRYFQAKQPAQLLAELEEQLARTRDFLAFAGHPQDRFRSMHVAGTSGKGSVTAMLAAVLSAARIANGYHVSPYLQIVNEKLVLDGTMITPATFVARVAALRELHARWAAQAQWPALKYGEAWVALTYLTFASAGVDWAVVETGLGGRYDPTNVLNSELAVITNIDYDHMHILGDALEDIAGHKAGIIKPGGLAVTGERKPRPLEVIQAQAKTQGAALYRLGEEFAYQLRADGLSVEGPYHRYSGIQLNLVGEFQPLNAAVAVAGLDVLREHRGLAIDEEHVCAGLAAVAFPGRMEVMQQRPLVILDGAHNPAKMRTLVDSFKAAYPGRTAHVLLGILAIKEAQPMLAALDEIAQRWTLTQPAVFGKPALAASDLASALRTLNPAARMHIEADALTALGVALAQAAPDDIVLLTGSIYLVGALRGHWFPVDALLGDLI